MNIYLHELNVYRKSTLLWTVTLVLVVLIFMSIYPSFSKDVSSMERLIEAVPESVRSAIGIEVEQFFSLLGFYSYIFLYIKLLGAIQAMNLGIGIISKEVRDKTADFLLTKPVSRVKILLAKMAAVLTCILITNVIFIIITNIIVSSVATEPFNTNTFIKLSLTLFFIQLLFLSIGFMIAVIVQKIKAVLPVSLGIVFMFFLLNLFSSSIGDDIFRYFTPFQYVEPMYILKNNAYEPVYLLLASLILVASIIVSFVMYTKKDIPSV